MATTLIKKITLINTFDLQSTDDETIFDIMYQDQKDEADLFLELALDWYEHKYHTTIGATLLSGKRSSCYGSIAGNNQNGGILIDLASRSNIISNIINNISWSFDDIIVEYTEDKKISITTYDHDGSNHTQLRFVPESVLNSNIDPDFDVETYVYYNGTDSKVVNKIMKNKPFTGNIFPNMY